MKLSAQTSSISNSSRCRNHRINFRSALLWPFSFAALITASMALAGCSSSADPSAILSGGKQPGGKPVVSTVPDKSPQGDIAIATSSKENEASKIQHPSTTAADTTTTPDAGNTDPDEATVKNEAPNDETTATPENNASASTNGVSGDQTTTIPVVKPKPGGVKVLIPEKEFKIEGPEDALRVSYDDIDLLKVINMEPVTADAPNYMPTWLKGLDGKRVRIRGYMFPPFEQTDLTWFDMARDTQICCFGREPKIYDVFRVRLREGETTDYIELKPFDVVGVFHIDPVQLGDDLIQMYNIDDAVIVKK